MSIEIETRVVIDGKPYYTNDRDEAVKEVVRRRLIQAIGSKFPQEPENSVSRVAVILGELFVEWEEFHRQTNELISEIDRAFKSAEDGRAHIRHQQRLWRS